MSNKEELIASLERILSMSLPTGIEAGDSGIEAECRKALELARIDPPRAPPGTAEIGLSPDEREVVMNLPSTPDNGTGFVHYVFTPHQAINAAEVLIKAARQCKVAVVSFGGQPIIEVKHR